MKKVKIIEEDNITCPEQVFLAFYCYLLQVDPASRTNAAPIVNSLKNEYNELLLTDDGKKIAYQLLNSVNTQFERRIIIGRMFGILSAIDSIFQLVHPRTTNLEKNNLLPKWLRRARDNRTIKGYYACSEVYFLLPKGPLLRLPREENQACADFLPDLYTYISLSRRFTSENQRKISINISILPFDIVFGVLGPAEIGAEEIVFIPIAEKVGELELKISEVNSGGVKFYDTNLAPGVIPSQRVFDILQQSPNVDIMFAPELVISAEHTLQVIEMLKGEGKGLTKMFLAGSGSTIDHDDNDMPWNEARVLNGYGEILWTQKKIWPAGLQPRHVFQYGLGDTIQPLHLEKNASGNHATVVDIDGFGRCLILICQDIQAMPLSFDLISQYQPDWVFVPILDQGTTYNGWAHQRIFELSAHSQARFLVSCSQGLMPRSDASDLGYGLAVGPKSSVNAEQIDRACMLVQAQSPDSPSYGKMNWKKCNWRQSKFATD